MAVTSASSAIDVPPIGLNGRRFGVEIEFVGAYQEAVAEALETEGLKCQVEFYNHAVRDYWKIVEEGGLAGELVSPPLAGEDGARQIALASRALIRAGASDDFEAGLHVHHEVKDLDHIALERLAKNYGGSQRAIDKLVSAERLHSEFHYPFSKRDLAFLSGSKDVHDLAHKAGWEIGRGSLSLCSIESYGTVEFRQHQSTMDADEILRWVAFGQALVNASAKGAKIQTGDVSNLLALLVDLGGLSLYAQDELKRHARS